MQSIGKRALQAAAAVAATLAAASVNVAQAAEPAETSDTGEMGVNEVVVTGTRLKNGIAIGESPSPIVVLSGEDLKRSGQPDLMTALASTVPSFVAQAYGFDMANQTLQAKLRGLSPNDVLILVNGKRRHTTANLEIDQSPFQGGAGADLNFIPLAAIDHIEVLTEGAAAQYGSDAIAGVINIILKNNASGGLLSGQYGGFFDGGGVTSKVEGNAGFQPIENSYFNVTAQVLNHGHTQRGNIDPRVIDPANLSTYPGSNMTLVSNYPYINLIQGDAEVHMRLVSFNSGFELGGDTQFYSFGTYGYKDAASFENYRVPTKAQYTDPATGQVIYQFPFGFDPMEQGKETDFQLTAGLKGAITDWNWDLASGYGEDHMDVYTIHSTNPGLYALQGSSPTDFYDGKWITTQWTTTLDISRDFDVGMAGPLNLAFGGEYRRESYQIVSGDTAAYIDGGAASFTGYAPYNDTNHSRKNYAGYLDLAGKPIDGLRLDVAGRYEHYTDFGNATVGKLTGRYDFTSFLALRGTASTGFRAPTLAEEYYTGVNVGPGQAFGQLAPNGTGASLLGLGTGLKPEKSQNYSVGLVFRPLPSLLATLDLYQINLHNRIVGTGNLFSQTNGTAIPGAQNITAALQASGLSIDPQVLATGTLGINIFANGIDTRTRGADFTLSYPGEYSFGRIDYSVAATWNQTSITSIIASPAQLGGQSLFGATALADLTTASPKVVVNLGAYWTYGRFSANLHEIIYGPTSEWNNDYGDNATGIPVNYNNTMGTIPITNLELGMETMKGLKLFLGATNLFNRYPAQYNSAMLNAYRAYDDNTAVEKYVAFSPFGIDGGFYYAKATYSF